MPHSRRHPPPDILTDRLVFQINFGQVLGFNLTTLVCPACAESDWQFCLFRGTVDLHDWPFVIPVLQN